MVQCFGEFSASGRARTIKIGRHVMGAALIDLLQLFSPIPPSGRLKG